MKENERRAGRVIENDSSLYKQVMQALETNESIKYEDGVHSLYTEKTRIGRLYLLKNAAPRILFPWYSISKISILD